MLQRVELVLLPEVAANDSNHLSLIASRLGCTEKGIRGYRLYRRSIDARSRQVKVVLLFDVAVGEELPELAPEARHLQHVGSAEPILIAGCGPAGMFAAIRLIELGYKPVIIERGKDVRNRRRDLAAISKNGEVNPDSNYCFGEGGAGTYSDGKLYTRSDKRGNIRRILSTFVQFGADPSILINTHPHIGTNKLPGIVSNMREQILQCGGEILFNTRLEKIRISNGALTGADVRNVDSDQAHYSIPAKGLILATGHSARDIFRMLQEQGIRIEAKAFALGVRIEHPQALIDSIQYHCPTRGEFLPPAAYTLTGQHGGRGVYSFCMCPGGIIAPAATAPGELVVNGWSPSKRNNPYANSGMVVSVDLQDFARYQKHGALAAMEYQAAVEQACFTAGGGRLVAPAQRMADFCEGKLSVGNPDSSYQPGTRSVNLKDVLPPEVSTALQEGLMAFGKKMRGYYTNEAVLLATESRTSSPVRIPRDKDTCMHPELSGLFPCAEGAGYAGGIVSAAMDGERCAEEAAKWLKDA